MLAAVSDATTGINTFEQANSHPSTLVMAIPSTRVTMKVMILVPIGLIMRESIESMLSFSPKTFYANRTVTEAPLDKFGHADAF